MLAVEGKRGVGGEPHKPGVIISSEERNIPIVSGKELILVVLRRPEQCVDSGFWHRCFLKRLVIPNNVFLVIIPSGMEECK
jgi:hypothetical protein